MNKIIFLMIFVTFVTYGKDKFLIGEYPLKGDVEHAVVDGDTIKVKGLDASIRVLFIDTEESFKHKTAKVKTDKLIENWDDYISIKENSVVDKPIKFNTPLGYEATLWARDFFKDSDTVRLEYDNPDNKKGFYDRYLAYVFAKKDNKWVNFNIEIVKYGYTPYSTKYGQSQRFHKEFVAAQKYAQKHKLGIWNPEKKHYTDYDKRLKWWNKRGVQIAEYYKKFKDSHIYIGGGIKEYFKLKKYINKKVKIFTLLKDVEESKTEFTFNLPVKRFLNVVAHLSKKSGITAKDLKSHKDYYIYLEGDLKKEGKKYHIYITKKSGLKFAK